MSYRALCGNISITSSRLFLLSGSLVILLLLVRTPFYLISVFYLRCGRKRLAIVITNVVGSTIA